jgi:hypothetical protein
MREIVNDVGMRAIERTGRGIVAIAFFGNRCCHDGDLRIGKALKKTQPIRTRKQRLANAADDAGRGIHRSGHRRRAEEEAALELLSEPNRPTALLCFSDVFAIAAIGAGVAALVVTLRQPDSKETTIGSLKRSPTGGLLHYGL